MPAHTFPPAANVVAAKHGRAQPRAADSLDPGKDLRPPLGLANPAEEVRSGWQDQCNLPNGPEPEKW
jgi:hypothetical protein